jgi:hypothetical protein
MALGNSGYSSDIVLTATGDFLVLVDTPTDPAASIQRLNRIVLTDPLSYDADNNPAGRPDDLFNPWFGSGVRVAVGRPLTSALTAWIQNHVIAAIAADPNFSTIPAPSVTPYVDGTGDGQILLSITVSTMTGVIVVQPAQPLQQF